jgi:hypothetical protein
MEIENKKEKTNYFTLLALLLIVVAMIFSYFKYYVNLDYDTLLAIECDPSIDVCFYDEESYYQKFLIYTKTLDENCSDASNEQCIVDLWKKDLATLIECNDENLEEWEVCSDPSEFVAEDEEVELEEEITESPETLEE